MRSHHTTDSPNTISRGGTRRWQHRRSVAALGVALLVMTACGSDDSASSEPAVNRATDGTTDEFMSGDDAFVAGGEAEAPQTGGAASAGLPLETGRDVIQNVGITMSTSDVGQTADDIRRLATSNGGAVFGSDITIGDVEDDGSVPGGGQIVIRVPPDRLDALVQALDGVGYVSRLSQDAQDVTDQLVDLDVRIRQAEKSVERVELLLAEATELGEVFAIETELTERQIILEQLRAAERNTSDLVALATLTVQVEYRTPDALEAIENGDGIGDGFASGWNAFVGGVFALGYVLAVGAPFLVTLLAVLALAWMLGRRWARRQAERREQRRLAADRRGPALVPASGPSSPPPPRPAERRADDGPVATHVAAGTDTVTDGDATPAE